MSSTSPIARLHKVGKLYVGGAGVVAALHDLSLDFFPGMTVLSGPSGCGKSTLINLLGALDKPSSGIVEVSGQDVGRLEGHALDDYRRKTIGIVFQFFHLMPVLTVRENVALPAEFAGMATKNTLQRAEELLALVGLEHRATHRPHELSGGEIQRTAIARALVNKPALLLADEPTGNLDSAASARIMDLLADAASKEGASAIVATHDPDVVRRADRIVHLLDGEITSIDEMGVGRR